MNLTPAADRWNQANFVVCMQKGFGFRVFFVDCYNYLHVRRSQSGIKGSDRGH